MEPVQRNAPLPHNNALLPHNNTLPSCNVPVYSQPTPRMQYGNCPDNFYCDSPSPSLASRLPSAQPKAKDTGAPKSQGMHSKKMLGTDNTLLHADSPIMISDDEEFDGDTSDNKEFTVQEFEKLLTVVMEVNPYMAKHKKKSIKWKEVLRKLQAAGYSKGRKAVSLKNKINRALDLLESGSGFGTKTDLTRFISGDPVMKERLNSRLDSVATLRRSALFEQKTDENQEAGLRMREAMRHAHEHTAKVSDNSPVSPAGQKRSAPSDSDKENENDKDNSETSSDVFSRVCRCKKSRKDDSEVLGRLQKLLDQSEELMRPQQEFEKVLVEELHLTREVTQTHQADQANTQKALIALFTQALLNSRAEHEWYGPWNTLLTHTFPSKIPGCRGGFQIAPQHIRDGYNSATKYPLFFLIMCDQYLCGIVEIRPPHHLRSPAFCEDAYKQLVKWLRFLYEDKPSNRVRTPAIYSIQAMGPYFMNMKLNCMTACLEPKPHRTKPKPTHIESRTWSHYPKHWWCHNIMSLQGSTALLMLANTIIDVTEMYEHATPLLPNPDHIPLTLEDARRMNIQLFGYETPSPPSRPVEVGVDVEDLDILDDDNEVEEDIFPDQATLHSVLTAA
ncbi:hypothetical protein M422DRAFT_261213 [Sphaerobolus stellatus SS14]|uniref:Uncharacterized protein n=1 Tax=Sphaerobolus stellatus (strain SS14) TaxID=990650 RepID=A0A0C9U135_SPHS4|nr:hypothetical protein M422DRAFT_261213 [Sphaerobolus stellatus SS14]